MADGNIDLFAKFEVNQSNGSADLFAEFRVYPHFSGIPRNLFAKFFRGADGSRDLFAKFNVVATKDLYAKFTVRHSASVNLFSEFRVYIHYGEGKADLKAEFIVVRFDDAELFADFIVRQLDSANLFSEAVIRQENSADLFSEAVIRHSASLDLKGIFIVRHSASLDLPQKMVIRHSATKDLFFKMVIIPAVDLKGVFTVRHTTSKDLKSMFYVRHAYWMWTRRRYIHGVVDTPEKLIGDANLEYVIEGVMEDIQGILEANSVSYDGWDNITLVPVLIRRATTYGAVAALYARHSRTFRSRVIPTVAPVTVTTLGDDERAMNFWQDKMDKALANYFSIIGSPVLWVSTASEDPVFSMADIPTSEWNRDDDLAEWHVWLSQRGS